MKIKMLTSVVCNKLVFSHGQIFETNKNIDKSLAEEFIKLKRAKVVEEDVEKPIEQPVKKKTTKKVKSSES